MPEQSGQVLIRRAAVLGSPIEHSLSPVLHRAAYEALGLDDWRYERFEVDESALAEFVGSLGTEWAGLSLTMPLKEEALVLAAHCDPIALQTGAVNTLVPTESGWHGYNTDVHGVVAALQDAGVGTAATGRALVLGSGATARSVLAALAELGVLDVTLAVRKDARASTLAQANDHEMTTDVVSLTDAGVHAHEYDLVISTLPPGGADGFAGVASASPVRARTGTVWMDAVYAGWPTAFADSGEHTGARVVSGLEMLIHQAVRQVELMTGRVPPLNAVQQAGHAALAAREA